MSLKECTCTQCAEILNKKPNGKVEIWFGGDDALKNRLATELMEITGGNIIPFNQLQFITDKFSHSTPVYLGGIYNVYLLQSIIMTLAGSKFNRVIFTTNLTAEAIKNLLPQFGNHYELRNFVNHNVEQNYDDEKFLQLFKAAVDHSVDINQFKKIDEACHFSQNMTGDGFINTFRYVILKGTFDQVEYMIYKYTQQFTMVMRENPNHVKNLTANSQVMRNLIESSMTKIVYVVSPVYHGSIQTKVFRTYDAAEIYVEEHLVNSVHSIQATFIE